VVAALGRCAGVDAIVALAPTERRGYSTHRNFETGRRL
jgi:hypothetical protein